MCSLALHHYFTLLFVIRNVFSVEQTQKQNSEEWMNRFSAQLVKTFAQYTHLDILTDEFSTQAEDQIFEKTTKSLLESADNVKQGLQDYFDDKIHALRSLVNSAEAARRKADLDKPNLVEECTSFTKKINASNVYGYSQKSSSKKGIFSAVHITLDAYKCDTEVMQDFDWTESQELEASLKDNYKKDPSIRQYIGTYSGLTRIFPGFRWDLNPIFAVDLFDPRYRPWFVVAETAPRNIIFLIDYSGSAKGQNIHLTKMTIMYILTTLTPNDYFTGIWYNSKKEFVLSECCSTSFLPATSRNKRLFKRYLDKIEEKDQAFLPTALNMSFTQFLTMNQTKDPLSKSMSSGGHKLVMLFTDGIEFWPTEEIREYQDQHPNDIIRVFGYSMGRGTGTQAALEWISCMTNAGGYEIVDSISDVKRKSRGYLTKLSEILALSYRHKPLSERPISWPFPYMDAQKRGATITLSMPILGSAEGGGFAGIAAIDFNLDKLRSVLQEFGGVVGNTFAFIIDNNGIVYYHPAMKIPKKEVYLMRKTACHRISTLIKSGTRVQYSRTNERIQKIMGLIDSISTMDILEIEIQPSIVFEKLRKRMIDGKCKEGEVVEDSEKEYHCMAIKGTPLSIAFVRNKGKMMLSSSKNKEKRSDLKYLNNNNLVGYWLKDGQSPCNDEVASFSPLKRFHKLIQLNKQKECVLQGLEVKHPLLTGAMNSAIKKWHDSWPMYEEEVVDPALNTTTHVEGACSENEELYILPSNFNSKYFLDSFVEFVPSGLTSFYPKCEYLTLMPVLQNKHVFKKKKSLAKISLNLLLAANVLTITKEEYDKKNQLLANVGCQFTASFIHDKFQRSLAVNGKSWMDCRMKDKRCLLVTSTGFVVASSDKKFEPVHLSIDEPQLFDTLLRKNILKTTKWIDYQEDCQMPKPNDGRQQYQGNIAMAPAAASRNAGSFDVITAIQFLSNKMANLAATLIWFEFSMFFRQSFEQSNFLENECDFESLELVEQCAMEHTNYRLSVQQTINLKAVLRTGCFGNLTIVPASDTELNLFVLDTKCDDIPTMTTLQRFLPYQITDCNMTNPRYRKPRSDLDYTTNHPQESIDLCSSSSVLTLSSLNTITCIFIELILPFTITQIFGAYDS